MVHAKTLAKCKAVLVKLMSWLFNHEYEENQQFSREQLSAVSATDIVNYFKFRCYDTLDPEENAVPVVRNSALKFWKKSISYFMPNKHMQWNELTNTGNPTRSLEVAAFLKDIQRKETRRQGAPSQARRPLAMTEFRAVQTHLKENANNFQHKYGTRAHNDYQHHLIGRIDDCTQLQYESLQENQNFPEFTLKTKLNWSKNVQEERDCPWQMVLGSIDSLFCVLISLALWLEVLLGFPYGQASPYVFAISADVRVPQGGYASKTAIQNYCRNNIFSQERFLDSAGRSLVGSHSVRKFASADSRNKGASKDEKDHR